MIKILQLIGKHVIGEVSEIQKLLVTQEPYTKKYITTVAIDPLGELKDVKIETEEYQEEREEQYLRGTVSSGGSSFSPTMNIDLTKVEDYKVDKDKEFERIVANNFTETEAWKKYLSTEEGKKFLGQFKKAVNINQNIINALSKKSLKTISEDSLVKLFYLWIKENEEELTILILLHLIGNWLEYQRGKKNKIKPKKNNPGAIIFKYIDSTQNKEFYLGEIEEFVDLYKSLVDEKLKKLKRSSACFSCGNTANKANRPTIGIFNLDMRGFVVGFGDNKKSPQYVTCEECNIAIRLGFRLVEKHMRFDAFKTEKGQLGSKSLKVEHYLIPLVFSPKLLRDIIEGLKEGSREKIDTTTNIQRVNRRVKQELKKQKKIAKKRDSESVSGQPQSMDITDIITKMLKRQVNYIDLYFFTTGSKQRPPTKEIVASLQLTKPSIIAIRNATNELEKLNLKFSLYSLVKFLSIKVFFHYMHMLYIQQKTKTTPFVIEFNKKAIGMLKDELVGGSKKKLQTVIFEFKKAYLFMVYSNVFEGEKNIMRTTTAEEEKTPRETATERIDRLKKEIEHPFFVRADLKAAAGIGLYFNSMRYIQEKVLGTRTLIKNARIWMKEFNKENLLKIFAECNRINFIIQDKERMHSLYNKVRLLIEEYIKDAEWKSRPEELSLAFMIGYDSYYTTNQKEEKEYEE